MSSSIACVRPLPVEAVVASATRRSMLRHDGHYLYWLEQRPEEQGRGVIVRWSAETGCLDLTPESLSVRSRVHEYGGGEFAVLEGALVFTAEPEQQVWLRTAEGQIHPLTSASVPSRSIRYADFSWHPNGQWIYAVRERHVDSGVINDLVALSLTGVCHVIAEGADFYAAPCVSPDGSELAWLQWSHPLMPWDGTELFLAKLKSAIEPYATRVVAGGEQESVLQPGFSRDGRLFAVNDRHGYWQLGVIENDQWRVVHDINGEAAVAPWSLGTRTWCESHTGAIWSIVSRDGVQTLWCVNVERATSHAVVLSETSLGPQVAIGGESIFLQGAAADRGEALLAYNVTSNQVDVVRPAPSWPANAGVVSAIRMSIGEQQVPIYFYPPEPFEKPWPLVMFCHSGPTGSATPALQAAVQFWTSRGYAVADVNYRGSDGFGRAWRQSLLGHWGAYDVTDCLTVIEHLTAQCGIDRSRVYIRGNSAGGLTVLQMLAQSSIVRAAVVRYPVVDLPTLAAISHKFEACYLLRLVGAENVVDEVLYEASPSHHLQKLRTPMLIQQGDQDPVVPLEQARQLAAVLENAGVEVALQVYAGEGHGFRRAETLAQALEEELAFFNRHR